MLSYILVKNHAGILLVGDYTSLTWFHEVVHDVNDRSPLVVDKEGSFLGLAYDVRKAFERQREVIRKRDFRCSLTAVEGFLRLSGVAVPRFIRPQWSWSN